jgi:SAM-dependent methyltransferase
MKNEMCKICGNTKDNMTYTAREMMFGFRDEFEYLKCPNCKCLQIKEAPPDISKYYPGDYYSFYSKGEEHYIQTSFLKSLKRRLKKKLLDYYLQADHPVGSLLAFKFKSYYPWIKRNTVTSRSHILDVGCGAGELLLRMYNDGFRHLTGLDPFIKEDIHYNCGIIIHKKTLDEFSGNYDMIMLHHAFEHMDHPLAVMKSIYRLLNDKGLVLIRIPLADGYSWRKYGIDWVQLDAPRHFFLHTTKSMQLLCDQTGFKLTDVVYDSCDLQFQGSELYQRNIPLRAGKQIFSKAQLVAFAREATRLNSIRDGDAACFYLCKQ